MIWRIVVEYMVTLINTLYSYMTTLRENNTLRRISKFKTSPRYEDIRKVSATQSSNQAPDGYVGKTEMDSHADTIVAGRNCIVMKYTDRSCNVSPYSDDYEPIRGVPIVQAATGYTSANGRDYILIFNEALWMENLDHSLVNPNQLRHFESEVQDNPYSDEPMSITSPDGEFVACLLSQGTTIHFDTWRPSQSDLERFPHIVLSSPEPWDPSQIQFPGTNYSEREEMELRNIKSVSTMEFGSHIEEDGFEPVYDIGTITTRLIESVRISFTDSERIIGKLRSKKEQRETSASVGPLEEHELRPPHTFLSKDRHSSTTPEELSERWGLSLAQAKLTLKATTRRLVRSALMPLARRYRVDRMFDVKRLRTTIATDTMDARVTSIQGDRYCQVFGSKDFFVDAFPIEGKGDAYEGLDEFVRKYGAPDWLIYDGSAEQGGRKSKFQRLVRKYHINPKVTEPNRSNQNPAEGVIRELRKKWYRTIFRTNCPRRLWSYGIPHVAKIMSMTASYSGNLDGRTPLEAITGETPDISEYLDFGFYDRVWFKQDAGIGEVRLGRFLGVSHRTGSLMSYWVLPASGIPESRTTVQRVTLLESQTEANIARFAAYDAKIKERFKEDRLVPKGEKPDPSEWAEILEDDLDFAAEFARIFNNPEVKEADDDFDPDTYDSYLNMELALDRGGENPEVAKVVKRLKDKDGRPIGTSHDNPILDTRMYEVEYRDGHRAALAANVIAENMFAQVDEEGRRHMMLDSIVDMRTNGDQVEQKDAFVTSSNGVKRRRETTKGWECCALWKDGSTSWGTMKDMKDSYPVELAEFAVENGYADEPAFAWWISYVLKKRDRIVAKVKSKYWQRTHKYGLRVPKTVKEAIEIDRENGNTLWWDALMKEMLNVRPAFEVFEGKVQDLPVGYQRIKCHVIWDIKLGENFRRKARLVAGGHTTKTPAALTYSSVVSRDSVRIALTVAALNDLDILACDIQNAYLTAKCRERIYTEAGPEFGHEEGTIFIVKMALYGLKSSGAAFRAKLAGVLHDLNYRPSKADPDVWLKPAVKPDGFEYYEMVLCYVDDVLAIGHEPMRTIEGIQKVFKLKDDKAEAPDVYLGASLQVVATKEGTKCWTMSSEKYVKAAIANVEEKLGKNDERLPTKCITPTASGYHPSEDTTQELDADGLQLYQELIGVLRWAIEIGRVDILLEVALLSSHLALPRVGHLNQVYHIFGYLKASPRRRLYFDPTHPKISEARFHKFDWEDFYRDAKEPIPLDAPEPRGRAMSTHCFVDANHAADKITRRSQSGILIFCNRAPIMWYSKRQNSVETSTFGSEFSALKQAVEMVQGLRYKLRMFGVPIEGPTNMFCDNEAVYKNASTPESVLNKKHHSVAYHACREAVASGMVRIAKEDTLTNLSDVFTKTLSRAKRESLLELFMY